MKQTAIMPQQNLKLTTMKKRTSKAEQRMSLIIIMAFSLVVLTGTIATACTEKGIIKTEKNS